VVARAEDLLCRYRPFGCRGAWYEGTARRCGNRLLESRRLTQAAAATALSISQPKISALKNYKLEGFSVEGPMTFLTALGSDIEIRVHLPKRSSSPGRILVNALLSGFTKCRIGLRCLRGPGGRGVRSGDANTLMDF